MRDSCFIRGKVPMTKEEVRSISLSKLQLGTARTLLDIGAGTGSVGIQGAIEFPALQVTGIEQKAIAVDLIKENIRHFGVTNYRLISAKAPTDLAEQVDRIFIGGSGGNLADIIKWSYNLLTEDGRLVLTFILLENALAALTIIRALAFEQIEAVQVQIGELTQLGQGHYFKQQNPTIIISCQKMQGVREEHE